jgi:2-epi-valiolone-7-phosphate 1-reductase
MPSYGSHQALIRRGKTLETRWVATDAPHACGLLVRMSFVGICGTDLQILNGSRPDTADILGHEGVGIVAVPGRDAPITKGTKVVFNPTAQLHDGRILGHNTPGLFQSFVNVGPLALEDGLVLPMDDSSDLAACDTLTEPLATVVFAHQLISGRVENLRTAVVFGGGPVGLLATIYLRGLGVRVLLVLSNRTRLETVVELNIIDRDAALIYSGSLQGDIVARNHGDSVDAALICTTRSGAPAALRQAVPVVRDGGCIDLLTNYPQQHNEPYGLDTATFGAVRSENVNGIAQDGGYAHHRALGRNIAFTSHRGSSREHLLRAQQLLKLNRIAYDRLVTHTLPLDQAGPAIETLAHSGTRQICSLDCIKLVIDMRRPDSSGAPSGRDEHG